MGIVRNYRKCKTRLSQGQANKMLRSVLSKSVSVARAATKSQVNRHIPVVTSVRGIGFFDNVQSGLPTEEYEERLVDALERPQMTAEDLRLIFSTLHHLDYIPDGKVCCAFLKSARRFNDF